MDGIRNYWQNCFNTQPPEGGWFTRNKDTLVLIVSTHSRLKAAGIDVNVIMIRFICFNTQPPEGGWI